MDDELDVRNLPIAAGQYEKCNYEIQITSAKKNNCLICFSGNGLYFPNTVEAFEERVIESNRFEWKNICQNKLIRRKFKKIIYVRDIWKSWYLYGINSTISDSDKLLDFLRIETNGFDIYTVGNSAGGYAAVKYGCLLGARMVYNYSGQYEIESKKYWHIPGKENRDTRKNKISIADIVSTSPTKIAYFIPGKSEEDIEQYDKVRNCENVFPFLIKSEYHGTTVLGVNYKYIFKLSEKQLVRLSRKYRGKEIGRYRFLLSTAGVVKGLYSCFEAIRYKKKYKSSMGL